MTFTDKHCPGKHSNAKHPAKIMTRLYIIQHSWFLSGQVSFQHYFALNGNLQLRAENPYSLNHQRHVRLWLQRYYFNWHQCIPWKGCMSSTQICSWQMLQCNIQKFLIKNIHLSGLVRIYHCHSALKSAHQELFIKGKASFITSVELLVFCSTLAPPSG